MEIILNLEKKVKVKSIEQAKSLHVAYQDNYERWTGETLDNNSIIIENGNPIGFLSYNGRFWEWDDTNTKKEMGSVFSNPFTNGSICCGRWNRVKNKFLNS